MQLADMTLEQLHAEIAKRKEATTMPPPIALSGALEHRAKELTDLAHAVDIVVGALSALVHQTNVTFWTDAQAEHDFDVNAFLWRIDSGVLVPAPKPESLVPAGATAD